MMRWEIYIGYDPYDLIWSMFVLHVCWYDIVEFDEILRSVPDEKSQAVKDQCGDWQTFLDMSNRSIWQFAVQYITQDLKLAATASNLDVLWQKLHPSQSTGLSHSMHGPSYIYRSAPPDNDNIVIIVIMHRINLRSCLTDYVSLLFVVSGLGLQL